MLGRRLLSGFVLVLMGCGPRHVDLAGTVSYQGKKVVTGSVQVVGVDGIVKSSPISPQGQFVVREIAVGPIKAIVNSPEPREPAPLTPELQKRFGNRPAPSRVEGWFAIPGECGDFATTNLEWALTSDSTRWDIELK